jgi:hypothetical protein
MKQKGIISYGVAPNRQYPLAGAAHDAVFNTFRRFSAQVLYWAPPMVAGYYIMNWAVERYDLLADALIRHTSDNVTGTTTSTRRPAAPSLAARRSKERSYDGRQDEGACVINRRTCTSPTPELRIDMVTAALRSRLAAAVTARACGLYSMDCQAPSYLWRAA